MTWGPVKNDTHKNTHNTKTQQTFRKKYLCFFSSALALSQICIRGWHSNSSLGKQYSRKRTVYVHKLHVKPTYIQMYFLSFPHVVHCNHFGSNKIITKRLLQLAFVSDHRCLLLISFLGSDNPGNRNKSNVMGPVTSILCWVAYVNYITWSNV